MMLSRMLIVAFLATVAVRGAEEDEGAATEAYSEEVCVICHCIAKTVTHGTVIELFAILNAAVDVCV